MKKFFTLIIPVIILLVLSGCGKTDEQPAELKKEENFYFDDTKWGMPMDEVIALKGEPDRRNDQGEAEVPEGETLLVDFYYDEQELMEKYTATFQYQFDKDNNLEGVIASISLGEIGEDGSNLNDIIGLGKETYMSLRTLFSQQYGEPAAEYTAYKEGETYKTDEELNLEKEEAIICASRWDGDNYRFLYIVYYFNDNIIELRYIPHDKETVDKVNAEKEETAPEEAPSE